MKICFLAHAGSIHTKRWATYFCEQGHRVSVVSLTPGELNPPIELIVLPQLGEIRYQQANWHYLLHLPKLKRILDQIQPDLLNAHFLSSYGFLGALIRSKQIPYVISLHGSDLLVFPKRSPIHRAISKFSLRRANLITSVAEHMTNEIAALLVEDKPVLTLQYGIDTARFFPTQHLIQEPLCLSNRQMVQNSNLDTVLDAAYLLQEQNSPLQIDFWSEGELSGELVQQAQNLNLSNIRFRGVIETDQMAAQLRSSAIYISMTASDGTSLSLLEAMACGAFPVVSDIPANREWIKDGCNGYLVPLHSPESLTKKLIKAWQDTTLREKAAMANPKIIRERADYRKNMARIEQAFLTHVTQPIPISD